MREIKFKITLHEDADRFVAEIPDLPECVGRGVSAWEAVHQLTYALDYFVLRQLQNSEKPLDGYISLDKNEWLIERQEARQQYLYYGYGLVEEKYPNSYEAYRKADNLGYFVLSLGYDERGRYKLLGFRVFSKSRPEELLQQNQSQNIAEWWQPISKDQYYVLDRSPFPPFLVDYEAYGIGEELHDGKFYTLSDKARHDWGVVESMVPFDRLPFDRLHFYEVPIEKLELDERTYKILKQHGM